MCDCAPLSPSTFGFTAFPPPSRRKLTIDAIQLSTKINGRIQLCPSIPRDLNPAIRRKFGYRSLRTDFSNVFELKFGRNGLVRSSSSNRGGNSLDEFVEIRSGNEDAVYSAVESGTEEEKAGSDASPPSSFDFLELKRELDKEERETGIRDVKDNGFIRAKGVGSSALDGGKVGGLVEQTDAKGRRQIMRRSNLLAKQVISIHSARSLGFVSQLWIDTTSWMVVLVEVRPNLLSGEIEKFLLEGISQVGDVVLIKDESLMENDMKMIGLDTLVGYNVVTSDRHNVGKVRGFTFNINSGAVESLELDSFGFSIIPSSLVSTYCLFVEDVLEVVSDTVVVDEGAVSRVQRLTKGIWDAHNVEGFRDEMEEYYAFRKRASRGTSPSSRGNFSGRKDQRNWREIEDDWELPMDYF